MPVVFVPGRGNIQFPDNMTSYQIQLAIEREIVPGRKPETISAPKKPEASISSVLKGAGQNLMLGLKNVREAVKQITPGDVIESGLVTAGKVLTAPRILQDSLLDTIGIGGKTPPPPSPSGPRVSEIINQAIGLGSPEQRARQAAEKARRAEIYGAVAARSPGEQRRLSQQSKAAAAKPEFDSIIGEGIYSGVSSLAQMAPGVAASVLTRSATPALASAGMLSASDQYFNVLDRGGTKEEALLAAQLTGATEVATEILPMGAVVKNLGKVGVTKFLRNYLGKDLPTELVATITQNAIDTAIANPDKTWADYFNELPSDLGVTAISTLVPGAALGAVNKGLQVASKFSGESQAEEEAAAPSTPPPADMEALNKALGPVGGKITLQEPSGPQEYTFEGFDEDGGIVLSDVDGLTFSEDPDQIQAAMKVGVADSEEGVGGMAFGMDITEGLPDVVAPLPPSPVAAPEPTAAPVITEPVREPELPPPPQENVRTVTTPGGSKVNTAFEVVDAADLATATGDLQNRDRSRAATDMQVQDIFSNFDPERLGESLESDRGSPIIGPDNTVESGNGRVMAINKVYAESPERAEVYRKFIESQGFDTSGYERPVLVRRRTDPMTPEERSKFVRESNMDTKLRLSTSEQAGTDAAALTADVMGLMASPDVNQAVNRDFVRGFLSKLPAQEQAGFLDKTGNLSAEGSRRLRTAIKASAYGDADLINALDESQDNNIKSIGGAIEDVAPTWRTMRDGVAEGRIRPEMDVTEQLVEAAKIVRDVRNRGQKINDFLTQQDAFNPLDPITERFIRSFYNQKNGKAAGRDAIADVLSKYARRAAEQTTEEKLFANEPFTPEQVLDSSMDGDGARQPDMYEINKQAMEAILNGTPDQMRNAVAKAQEPYDKIIAEGADLQKKNRGCD